ncbi:MAG: hypothetical protein KF817_05230 [Phycisphaeraceae bacterium]|nr:hypothetical protein [Phycisphaeraceae bacterium]
MSRRDPVAPCEQAGRTQWRDREARDPIRAEAADGARDSARHHLGHTVASDVDGDGAITTSGTDSDRGIIQTILALSGTGPVSITDAEYRAEADINRDGVISSADVSALGSAKSALAPGEISDRSSGTGPDSIIGWCGYVFIPETGFYCVRFRVYDVGLGRWTSRDPLGYVDGMGGYEYGAGTPLAHADPFGDAVLKLRAGLTNPSWSGCTVECTWDWHVVGPLPPDCGDPIVIQHIEVSFRCGRCIGGCCRFEKVPGYAEYWEEWPQGKIDHFRIAALGGERQCGDMDARGTAYLFCSNELRRAARRSGRDPLRDWRRVKMTILGGCNARLGSGGLRAVRRAPSWLLEAKPLDTAVHHLVVNFGCPCSEDRNVLCVP